MAAAPQHQKVKIHYWLIDARASLAIAICEFGNIAYEIVDSEKTWPALKPQTPFGQLPYIEDGNVKMAQSMAIARYLARKAKLDGAANEADFAMSEQLIEEQSDIYNIAAKAQGSDKRRENYERAISTEWPAHLRNLEKLLPSHAKHFGSALCTGDIAIFVVLRQLIQIAGEKIIADFPKLKQFYHHLASSPAGTRYLKLPLQQYLSIERTAAED